MQKLTLSGLFLFLTLHAVSAQIPISVRGGLNLSTISGVSESYALRPDIHVGVFLRLKILKGLYCLPEVQYSGEGFQYPNKMNQTHNNYLNLPLMLRFYPEDKVIYIEGGAQKGFLLSSKVYNPSIAILKENVLSQYTALNFGLGARWNAHFEFGARGIFGLDKKELRPNWSARYRNLVFQLSAQWNL